MAGGALCDKLVPPFRSGSFRIGAGFYGFAGTISAHTEFRSLAIGLAKSWIGAFGGHVEHAAAVMMKPAAILAALRARDADAGFAAIDADEFDHGRDGEAVCVSSQRTTA
jgi:hypothetical protein